MNSYSLFSTLPSLWSPEDSTPSLLSLIVLKDMYFFLLYVSGCFGCMCAAVCHGHAWLPVEARRGRWISWIWGSRQFVKGNVGAGTEPWSFAGAVNALNHQDMSPAPLYSLKAL